MKESTKNSSRDLGTQSKTTSHTTSQSSHGHQSTGCASHVGSKASAGQSRSTTNASRSNNPTGINQYTKKDSNK